MRVLKVLKLIFSLLVALIGTVFFVKNSTVVPIDLWPLPLQFEVTLSLLLLSAFVIGILMGSSIVWVSAFVKRVFKKPSEVKNK